MTKEEVIELSHIRVRPEYAWKRYEFLKHALPSMPAEEYEAAIAEISNNLGV